MARISVSANFWKITLAFVGPMVFGFGLQFSYAYLSESVTNNSRLLCEDGSRVKDRIAPNRRWILAHLSDFGEQARSLWKNCVCNGFEKMGCAALEVEIGDQLQVSQLNAVE